MGEATAAQGRCQDGEHIAQEHSDGRWRCKRGAMALGKVTSGDGGEHDLQLKHMHKDSSKHGTHGQVVALERLHTSVMRSRRRREVAQWSKNKGTEVYGFAMRRGKNTGAVGCRGVATTMAKKGAGEGELRQPVVRHEEEHGC